MPKDQDILVLFFTNESKIEKLYRMYMIEFPSQQKLWQKLLARKRYQVEILKDLSLRSDRFNFFNLNGYSFQVLKYVSNFIDEQFDKIRLGKIYLQDALTVALRLERSLKDKDSLKILEPKHAEVFKIFRILNHQTSQQINLLFKAYGKINSIPQLNYFGGETLY